MFRPLYKELSIQSVRLCLIGAGELAETDRLTIQKGYEEQWGAALPKEHVGGTMQITVGPEGVSAQAAKSFAPTQYVEYTRAGEPVWWMELANNHAIIGCTKYSGWEKVGRKAYALFDALGKTLRADHPFGTVMSAELTYEDVFLWEGGPNGYDPREVVREEWIPHDREAGMEWHAGQGWVRDPDGRRILERFQVGGVIGKGRTDPQPAILITTTVLEGFGTNETLTTLSRGFGHMHLVGDGPRTGRKICDELHERAKNVFRRLVTDDTARRVGLDQEHNEGAKYD